MSGLSAPPRLSDEALAALFAPLAGMERIGLAVSGGPDSLALLLLAARWAATAKVTVIVYAVDHGLRPEAAAEVALVIGVAASRGLAARGLAWTGQKPETGIQAAARAARYRLLAEAMAEDRLAIMLTAHHLGDQAETVLMRLAHGSGIEGLRGMDRFAQVEGCRIFRPLLALAPEMLAAIVADAGLQPVRDPSNGDRHYERVRWRQMLPALAELGLDARRIGQFAARMADADAALADAAETALARIVHLGADRDAELPRAGLAALPRAVGVRVLARVLAIVGKDRRPHGLGPVESLFDRLCLPESGTMTLHGCVVASDGVLVRIHVEAERSQNRALTGG